VPTNARQPAKVHESLLELTRDRQRLPDTVRNSQCLSEYKMPFSFRPLAPKKTETNLGFLLRLMMEYLYAGIVTQSLLVSISNSQYPAGLVNAHQRPMTARTR
jgi:hypothetical protein